MRVGVGRREATVIPFKLAFVFHSLSNFMMRPDPFFFNSAPPFADKKKTRKLVVVTVTAKLCVREEVVPLQLSVWPFVVI